jgi:hypothetical protein
MNQVEWFFESEALSKSLTQDFEHGLVIDDSGRRLINERTLAYIGPAKVEIFSKEHPPPHFRVTYDNQTANFKISDCVKINGNLGKFEKNVFNWHKDNKNKIIDEWNSRRPADCPVGKYFE